MDTNTATTVLCRRVLMTGAVALLGVTFTIAPAHADPARRQATVQFGDLNLATDAGSTSLYHRLRAASIAVCGNPAARDLGASARARDCREQAMGDAVAAVQSSRFSAWYAAKAGHQVASGTLVASRR
jgi:UrcA family protein